MKAKVLLKIYEAAMKSEIAGTDFEKIVLAELFKYTKGITKIIPPGRNEIEDVSGNDLITLIKPSMKSLERLSENGVYNLNKQEKLESSHPDFIVEVLSGKKFFGFDNSWKIYIEAKSTKTGRFKFGQNVVDYLDLDEDSHAFKYLMWFAYRDPELFWNKQMVLEEFNHMKRKMLLIFKVLSGHDYRLIHAFPGTGVKPVDWFTLDDTIDLTKGEFNISPRGVLRFVFEGVDYFILEKVSSGTGEVRMYSKEKATREKAAKIYPSKVEEATKSLNSLILTFKAAKEITTVNTKGLPPDKNIELLHKIGQKIRIFIKVKSGKNIANIARIPKTELIAADTKINNIFNSLLENIHV